MNENKIKKMESFFTSSASYAEMKALKFNIDKSKISRSLLKTGIYINL